MTSIPDPRFPGGNYLDWLINLDPLELSDRNIEEVIEYNRQDRARRAMGGKAENRPTKVIDLEKIGLVTKAAPVTRRRI